MNNLPVDLKVVASVVVGICVAGAVLHLIQDTSLARYITRGLGG